MNVIILSAGGSASNINTDGYPISLTEIKGVPLIEILLKKWEGIEDVHFGVMFRKEDIQHHHLDQVVLQVCSSARVYPVCAPTAGAACTALMAIEQINDDQPLVILNGDEMLDIDYKLPLAHFENNALDAGTVIFDSIHPRYSYVRLDEEGLVIEAAEKKPISRNATAGFYWYRHGRDFVRGAMNSIRKRAMADAPYFICPVFNELILEGRHVGVFGIEKSAYKPFKSQQQLQQFQRMLEMIL